MNRIIKNWCRVFSIFLGLSSFGCSSSEAPQVFSESKGTLQGKIYAVDYAVQKEVLAYVVIRSWKMDSKQNHPKIQGTITVKPGSIGVGYQTLTLPSGTKIRLADSKKLIECSDTVLMELNLNITLSEWRRFLKSDPSDYSIKEIYRVLGKPVPEIKTTKLIIPPLDSAK